MSDFINQIFYVGGCACLLGLPISVFFFCYSAIFGVVSCFHKHVNQSGSLWKSMLLLYGSGYKSMIPIIFILSGLNVILFVFAFPYLSGLYYRLLDF